MKIRVDVMLKSGVLDPQGKAVEHALSNLGFKGASNVRIGKAIVFDMEGTDEAKINASVTEMCEKLLANTVIEEYKINTKV